MTANTIKNIRHNADNMADVMADITMKMIFRADTPTATTMDTTRGVELLTKVLSPVADGAVTLSFALVTGAGVYINTDQSIVKRDGVIDGGSGRTILVSGRTSLIRAAPSAAVTFCCPPRATCATNRWPPRKRITASTPMAAIRSWPARRSSMPPARLKSTRARHHGCGGTHQRRPRQPDGRTRRQFQ
jgi:hypothetical protein